MGRSSDEYIQAFSHALVINTFLKFAIFVLGLVCLALSGLVLVLMGKARSVMPLPIYIDKMTGAAKPVDFHAVDASGDLRIPVEIMDFCNTFVSNLYTFNRYTIKSNLDLVFFQSVPEVSEKIKYYLNESDRASYVRSNVQGLCKVSYTDVVATNPDIKVQVAFRREILSGGQTAGTDMVAIMRLKPVARCVGNSHGLLVVEYRESKLMEFSDEKGK